jgi:hypothetical protein
VRYLISVTASGKRSCCLFCSYSVTRWNQRPISIFRARRQKSVKIQNRPLPLDRSRKKSVSESLKRGTEPQGTRLLYRLCFVFPSRKLWNIRLVIFSLMFNLYSNARRNFVPANTKQCHSIKYLKLIRLFIPCVASVIIHLYHPLGITEIKIRT